MLNTPRKLDDNLKEVRGCPEGARASMTGHPAREIQCHFLEPHEFCSRTLISQRDPVGCAEAAYEGAVIVSVTAQTGGHSHRIVALRAKRSHHLPQLAMPWALSCILSPLPPISSSP